MLGCMPPQSVAGKPFDGKRREPLLHRSKGRRTAWLVGDVCVLHAVVAVFSKHVFEHSWYQLCRRPATVAYTALSLSLSDEASAKGGVPGASSAGEVNVQEVETRSPLEGRRLGEMGRAHEMLCGRPFRTASKCCRLRYNRE